MIDVAFVGVDPGSSGAVAAISRAGEVILLLKFKDTNETEVRRHFEVLRDMAEQANGALEKVHAMPKQGVSSTFKFGASFGALRAHLAWADVRYDMPTPHQWQTDLHCRTKGDKNITKDLAQRLFPDVRVTHAVADALLLAEWARRFGAWAIQPGGDHDDADREHHEV